MEWRNSARIEYASRANGTGRLRLAVTLNGNFVAEQKIKNETEVLYEGLSANDAVLIFNRNV